MIEYQFNFIIKEFFTMNSNRKIILIIFSMVSILTIIIVSLVAIGSRETGFNGAKKRAYLTAEIVKNALTSHMVNGVMDKRDTFLDSMKQLDTVEDLWIVRAKSVSEQFGPPHLNEDPRDEIDTNVLTTGVEETFINETVQEATLRITIPYIASSKDKPNCLTCHNAKEGEVLGAVSMVFDIQDVRMSSITTLGKIISTAVVFLIIILLFIGRKIKPYTTSFDAITETLREVHNGNYSVRSREGTFKEDKEASMWLNEIIEKLETVLTGIEKNLTAFVHNRSSNVNNDKLLTSQEIIEDIAEIYNFKKTIETDLSKEDIYYRLVQVLENKLEIKNFIIFENDLIKNERVTIYTTDGTTPCCAMNRDVKELCRAERTDMIIQSDNFPEICRSASCKNDKYICIPFQVNDQKSITISIICKTDETLKHSKYQIGIIKKYLEEAKPILESRMLMDVLRERNFVDGLTGLYNRKFLDEFVDRKIPVALEEGSTYAVMVLDVDYFKMVNDTYGHDAGDAILQKLSSTMKEAVRDDIDYVIRFGGEEFLILIKDPTEERAKEIATDINKKFSEIAFKFNNETFSKTVSIGYSFFPTDSNQFWRSIKYADLCLYEAKETGRNKVIKFTKDLIKNDKKEY